MTRIWTSKSKHEYYHLIRELGKNYSKNYIRHPPLIQSWQRKGRHTSGPNSSKAASIEDDWTAK